MTVSKNEAALALFSGVLGAFLHSSAEWRPTSLDVERLSRAATWLRENNPLFGRWASPRFVQDRLVLPSVIADSEERLPDSRPDIVLDPSQFDPVTHNEDYSFRRLPVAVDALRAGDCLAGAEAETEMLLFPILYPHGRGAYDSASHPATAPRRRYTLAEDTQLKLGSIIPHYRDDHYWPHFMYMQLEQRRIFQNHSRLVHAFRRRAQTGRLRATELLQQSQYGDGPIINEMITTTVPSSIRTGDQFFITAEAKIGAMLNAFAEPQLFVTLTFSEWWPDYMRILADTGNRDPTPSNRPWEAITYYYRRLQNLKDKFLRKEHLSGFGRLREWVERHEFQQRGAIHTHSLYWVSESIEAMIGREFIRADVPDETAEPELFELVQRHQIHRCSTQLCRRRLQHTDIKCTKGFPAELSNTTFQRPEDLRYTYKRLRDADRWVVPYSPRLLLLWQAHSNVQYCTGRGLARYITKYVTKAEPSGLYSGVPGSAINRHIQARRLGSMEVMALLLGKPIFSVSSDSIRLSTQLPRDRMYSLKPVSLILDATSDDDLFFKDTFEKYAARPRSLPFDSMTYFEYHTRCMVCPPSAPNPRSVRPVVDEMGYKVWLRPKVCKLSPARPGLTLPATC
jgi:hypothetical protein